MHVLAKYYAAFLILGTTALFGCDGGPAEDLDPVYNLQLLSGDNQSALQGTNLPEPLVLRVVDERSRPQSNVELRALITEGGGWLPPPRLVTDVEGRVLLNWSLGSSYAQGIKIWIFDQPQVFVIATAVARFRYEPPPEARDGWPTAALDLSDERTHLILDGIDEIRKGTYPEVHSLLIVEHGRLLVEAYWPGHDSSGELRVWDRDTRHEVQSASKSFRSMLVGIAIERGFIRGVNAPIAEFFPEYAHLLEGKQDILLEHVLTMSSGLEWTEGQYPYGDPRNTLSTMYGMSSTHWAEYVLSRPVAHSPGTVWFYNTGASIMLNRIVINATKMGLDNFVRPYYADLVDSAILPGVGSPLGAHTSPGDLAKFGQVFLDEGRWKGRQVASEDWIQQSFAQAFQVGNESGYGYQWWNRFLRTAKNSYRTYYASGNGGQFVFVIRDLNLVVVSTGGNFGSPVMNQMFSYLEKWVLPAFE